jgi:hypothetical protein
MNIPITLKYALIVVVGVVIVAGLSKWTGLNKPAMPAQVQSVVSRAADFNTSSHCNQDTLASLVDVTTALASLNTAVALSGDACVTRAAGVPTHTLESEMLAHQRQLMRQLASGERPIVQPLPEI